MMTMDQLDNAFPAFSTTALGAQFAVEALNYCSNKVCGGVCGDASNKKRIIKSYKTIIADTCVHPYGYQIIIKLLFCVDDMVTLNKTVIAEIQRDYDKLLKSNRVGVLWRRDG